MVQCLSIYKSLLFSFLCFLTSNIEEETKFHANSLILIDDNYILFIYFGECGFVFSASGRRGGGRLLGQRECHYSATQLGEAAEQEEEQKGVFALSSGRRRQWTVQTSLLCLHNQLYRVYFLLTIVLRKFTKFTDNNL
jgi:hypothetical protein